MTRTIVRSGAILGALIVGVIAIAKRPGSVHAATTLPAPVADAPLAAAPGEQIAIFAGGCFWGIEAVYEHVKGVTRVVSGYAGGDTQAPTYEQVTSGTTGHAEAVKITYDPSKVTYGQLLRIFFSVAHDPTQLNRQGPDVGTQYRSAVYYVGDEQKRLVESYIGQLTQAKTYPRPIVTEVAPLRVFYMAEDYHQDYAAQHPNQPYIVIHDAPKVDRLRKMFPELYREPAKN
jgi:peptide-methionine (S)-S-oxide reductase